VLFATQFSSSIAQMHVMVDVSDVTFTGVTPVPEPASAAMLALGLVVLAGWRAARWRARSVQTQKCAAAEPLEPDKA
jgi:hypothetical protein